MPAHKLVVTIAWPCRRNCTDRTACFGIWFSFLDWWSLSVPPRSPHGCKPSALLNELKPHYYDPRASGLMFRPQTISRLLPPLSSTYMRRSLSVDDRPNGFIGTTLQLYLLLSLFQSYPMAVNHLLVQEACAAKVIGYVFASVLYRFLHLFIRLFMASGFQKVLSMLEPTTCSIWAPLMARHLTREFCSIGWLSNVLEFGAPSSRNNAEGSR